MEEKLTVSILEHVVQFTNTKTTLRIAERKMVLLKVLILLFDMESLEIFDLKFISYIHINVIPKVNIHRHGNSGLFDLSSYIIDKVIKFSQSK